jgi:hypothetical protein
MEDYNHDTKHLVINQQNWTGIYMGIGLDVAGLLPFYLFTSFGVFMAMNLYRRRKIIEKYGGGHSRGIKIIFGGISSSSPCGKEEYSPLKYYSMNCGNEHKRVALSYLWFKNEKN